MARSDYLALLWDPDRSTAADTRALVRAKQALESDLRLLHQTPGVWVFGDPEDPISIRSLKGRGLVLGEVFDDQGAPGLGAALSVEAATSPEALAAVLARSCWGRYVAIFPGEPPTVFRDPLGGLECLARRTGGVTLVTSGLREAELGDLAPPPQIDWGVVAGFIVDPLRIADQVALTGIVGVRPGWLVGLFQDEVVSQVVWSPARLAIPHRRRSNPAEALPAIVDRCVAAWAGRYPKILAELSGGLDSAIVGAALTRAPAAEVGLWVNQFVDAPSGDERAYARAAAHTFDVRLHEVHRPPMRIAPDDFMALADGARPTLNGSDAAFDKLLADLAKQAGVQAIMTGQGGDVVFYELPTVPTAADRLRRLGPGGLGLDLLVKLAAEAQVSVWTVLRQTILGALGIGRIAAKPAPSHVTALAVRSAARLPRHPWVEDARRAPPAKALQLINLAYMQVVFGAGRRGRTVALLHPLLSQPVVEACLTTPADVLAEGGRGRGLVRRLWQGRIPQTILERRTKGDVTAYYGHAIAEGLEEIRPFLLDGRLVAQGLVDRDRLEARLQIETLAHEGKYGEILDLLAIEAWVRRWEGRAQTRAP